MDITIILSERGKELALVILYKYKLIGERKKDNLLRWRCTNNKCSAIIFSGLDKRKVIETAGQHNHDQNSIEKIETQVLRENCKRKAEESIFTRPLKIIRTELLNSSSTSNLNNQNVTNVRKAMYDKRKKTYPKLPTSLDEAIYQLSNLKNEECFKYKGQQFIYMPTDDNFVCLTTEQNIQFMANNCTEYFGDGTFNYAPKYFIQLYTIHGYKNGYYLPLVYFFLQNKTRSTYIKMWTFLNNLCLKLCEKNLQINTFHVDFEIGAHQAITDVFGNIKIIGCRFHLGQSWWKKIIGEPSLRIAYMDNSNELGKWLKMFFGLAFISPEEVVDAFHELISICPNDEGFIFSDYILHNYIKDHCQFPPNIWAEIPSLNPRTTNAAESFHRTYNSQFYSPHPHVHAVVRVLMETQAETSTKINSIRHKPGKLQSAKEIKKIEFNIQAYNQYLNRKNTESLLTYLSKLGNRYQGVSI